MKIEKINTKVVKTRQLTATWTVEPMQKSFMYGDYLPWYKRIFPWRWRVKWGDNWLLASEIIAEQIREEIDKEIIEKITRG